MEIYGEMSVESARAYYEYGNALLMQEEENPSKDLLGGVEEEGQEDEDDGEEKVRSERKGGEQSNPGDSAAGQVQEEEEGEKEQGAEEGEEEEGAAQEEQADDLQVAWEVLDVSCSLALVPRCSYEKLNHVVVVCAVVVLLCLRSLDASWRSKKTQIATFFCLM